MKHSACRIWRAACTSGFILFHSIVFAQSPVEVSNAWARATVPAQTVGGVYMDIRSSAAARLVSVASPVAGRVELHRMSMDNGVMKMTPVAAIELPAGQSIKLAPGGFHVMLIDLKQPLKAGDAVPVALTIERADKSRETVQARAEVRAVGAGAPAHQDGQKGH